ncbi:MAG: hypothetical protein HN738_02615 [Gammaproteobacteria bacterium]|jgi:hypothetical protein|nr:hypothetical protein [Gammaproteobacteria bacterium]
MELTTIRDAETFVTNSGAGDWEWGGRANASGFAGYLWRNYSDIDPNCYGAELAAYLRSAGENPADYGLPND